MTTAGLLDLTELSARSGVPAPRLRQFAEAGLLPPAHRDGDRLGYPPAEVSTARMLAGAEDLGLGTDTLSMLAAGRRGGECTSTQQRLADAVTACLDQVQADIAARNRQAVEAGTGTAAWATEIGGSASLSEDTARLQAVAAAVTTATRDGPCGDDCGCTPRWQPQARPTTSRTWPPPARRHWPVTSPPTAATPTNGSASTCASNC